MTPISPILRTKSVESAKSVDESRQKRERINHVCSRNHKKMKNASIKHLWIFLPLIAFGLIYTITGTYVYVDGDDASSVAYHVMGRDPSVQPPYSPYHGMMDLALSFLPAQETVVRIAALGITRYANVLMFILVFLLIFDWLQEHKKDNLPGFYLFFPAVTLLSAPEFFYLGLVYSPTLVAMCFILASHLILRYSYKQTYTNTRNKILLLGLSVILFGLGGAFRWNTSAYALVIAADILTHPAHKTPSSRLISTGLWVGFALPTLWMMISLSGYGLADFIAKFETVLYVMNQAGSLSPDRQASFVETIMRTSLNLTPLFTPVFLLLALIGFILLIKERNLLLIVVLAGILSCLPWIRSGVPKFIITAIPTLVLLLAVGLNGIVEFTKKHPRQKVLVYALIIVSLITPWLIGIRITRENTSWGPGFEIRRFDYQEPDKTSISITLGPGMAFPTPEGPRPLYGHAYILLGGWKTFVEKLAQERQDLIETALRLNAPIVVTSWSPDYYLNNLYNMGFYTSDNYLQTGKSGLFIERKYRNGQGKELSVLYSEMEGVETSVLTDHLMQIADHDRVILVGYARTMRDLYLAYPNTLQAQGTNSALIEMEKICQVAK